MYLEERIIYSALVRELNVTRLFNFTLHVGQMGAVKIYLSEGDPCSYFVSLEAVNKTKCTRRAQFSKT